MSKTRNKPVSIIPGFWNPSIIHTDFLVAHMRAFQEGVVAGHKRLVTEHASLWTEKERLRGKLAVGKYNPLPPLRYRPDLIRYSKSSIPQDARCREAGEPKANGQAERGGFAEALFPPEGNSGGGEKAQQSCQEESLQLELAGEIDPARAARRNRPS